MTKAASKTVLDFPAETDPSAEPLSATIGEQLAEKAEPTEAPAAPESAPVDRPLPGFEAPPYDHAAANEAIESQCRAVDAAERTWESAKEQAATLRKSFEREEKQLRSLIRQLGHRRRDAEHQAHQPTLRPASGGPGERGCAVEQTTGNPCPWCRLSYASGIALPSADDTDHFAMVMQRLEPQDTEMLADELRELDGVFIDDAVIEGWTAEQRQAVSIYLGILNVIPDTAHRPKRPEVLGTPHVADVADEFVQACKTCGAVLIDLSKPDAIDEFDVNDRVGTDCAGTAAATEPTEDY